MTDDLPDVIVACDAFIRASAGELATRWGLPVLMPAEEQFDSTGESSVWMTREVQGENVLLLASMRNDVHSALFKLMLLLGSLTVSGARKIDLFVPLLPYARSDRKSAPSAVPGRTIFLDALFNAGVNHIYTLDLHSPPPPKYKGRLSSLSSLSAVLKELGRTDASKTIRSIILPDRGAARRFGDRLTGEAIVVADKIRTGDDEVSVSFPASTVFIGDATIIDDAIFTGATHVSVAEEARRLGASEIHLLVTHVLPGPLTIQRLADAGVDVLTHFGTTSWAGDREAIGVRLLPWARWINFAEETQWSTEDRFK